jgi:mannose-6-phosphate isomerase-like protein (cupin superfamily)
LGTEELTQDLPTVVHTENSPVSGGPAYGTALSWRTLIDKNLTPTSGMTAGVIDMLPGAVGKLHWHAQAEIYFVLSGQGRVEIDGISHALKSESLVFIPGNAPHALTNTGQEDLRIFYIFAADGMADITYVFPDGSTSVLK